MLVLNSIKKLGHINKIIILYISRWARYVLKLKGVFISVIVLGNFFNLYTSWKYICKEGERERIDAPEDVNNIEDLNMVHRNYWGDPRTKTKEGLEMQERKNQTRIIFPSPML